MNWRERVVVTPDVLHGKPRINGTRIPVSVILDNIAAGHSAERIVGSYPTLTRADVDAAIAFAAELSRDHAATQLVKRHQEEEMDPELVDALLESMAQVRRGEFVDADVVLAEMEAISNEPVELRPVRPPVPNRPIKRISLNEWVNDNNPH